MSEDILPKRCVHDRIGYCGYCIELERQRSDAKDADLAALRAEVEALKNRLCAEICGDSYMDPDAPGHMNNCPYSTPAPAPQKPSDADAYALSASLLGKHGFLKAAEFLYAWANNGAHYCEPSVSGGDDTPAPQKPEGER